MRKRAELGKRLAAETERMSQQLSEPEQKAPLVHE
jgi:hypothetical protein